MKKCTAIFTLLAAMLLTVPAFPQMQPDKKPAPKTLQGTVTDLNGKPIPKALVYVRLHTPKGWYKPDIKLRTDKNGKYQRVLPMVNSNYLQVIAVADNYGFISKGIHDNYSGIDIALPKSCKFGGKIVDEQGKPLAGAKVTIDRCDAYDEITYVDMVRPEDKRSVTTGKDGRFSFDHMADPAGYEYVSAILKVNKQGRAEIRKNLMKADFAKDIVIKDPLECKIDGVLYLPNKSGTAPEGTRLMLTTNEWFNCRNASCDKDGRFHFGMLPPGKVSIMLDCQDPIFDENKKLQPNNQRPWVLPVEEIVLSPKENKTLDLFATTGAQIKGKVVDGNKPVPNAQLYVQDKGATEYRGADIIATNENGEFEARVVEGVVKMKVFRILGSEDEYLDFDMPPISLITAANEVKTDVVVKIVRSEESLAYKVRKTPITPGFELTAGTSSLTWDKNVDSSRSYDKFSGNDAKSRAKKLPQFKSANAGVFALPLDGDNDDRLLLTAVDESGGTGKGFDTAYVDVNRNGDLSDDSPFSFTALGEYVEACTDWVEVLALQGKGDEVTNNPMQVRLEIQLYDNAPYVIMSCRGGWKGTIDSNKGKIECVVIDANCNGTFGDIGSADDKLQTATRPDELYIDNNNFGSVVTCAWGPHCVRLYNVCQVGDKFYNIRVNPLGNMINVEPYTGDFGTIEACSENIAAFKVTPLQAYVVGQTGRYEIPFVEGKPIVLPAGKYAVNMCELRLEGAGKKPQNVTCAPDSIYNVTSAAPVKIPIGGKLSMAINPDVKELKLTCGETESINWKIKIGKTTISAVGDDSRDSPPKVKFFDKNGKLIHKTAAGYT